MVRFLALGMCSLLGYSTLVLVALTSVRQVRFYTQDSRTTYEVIIARGGFLLTRNFTTLDGRRPDWHLGSCPARVYPLISFPPRQSDLAGYVTSGWSGWGCGWVRFEYPQSGQWSLLLPFWPVILLAVWPTCRWWQQYYRRRHGFCRHCGYNLTGNVSGRCPECGKNIFVHTPSPLPNLV